MEKVQKYIPIMLLIFIFIGSGCRGRTNKLASNTPDQKWETAEQNRSDSLGTDQAEVRTYNSIEDFYQSLPQLSLPLTWDSEQFERMVPVPERIYRSITFGLDHSPEVFKAVRLPEKDGIRSVIVHYEDVSDYMTMYLYIFKAEKMEQTDMHYIYNVREIDGGQNTLITSFEIDRLMGIELKTMYAGEVENGEFGRVLFGEEYCTITPEGKLETLINMEYGVISYTEEEDTVFGESFPSYKFTITNKRLCLVDEDDPDTYEFREVGVERYMINDEGWLIEVDSFQ